MPLSPLETTVAAIRQRFPRRPRAGIVLGTGLQELARAIQADAVIPYAEIPNFSRSTAIGHKGELVCGDFLGEPVVTMNGRFHGYEGYSPAKITFPMRVMHALGCETVVILNAAGGINLRFQVGDVMILESHLNFLFRVPELPAGHGGDRPHKFGPVYDPELADAAERAARKWDFTAHRGCYAALLGPTYETRAEIRMLGRLGADVVGMSTVPEAMVAATLGMRVLAISTITNLARPDTQIQVDGHSVKEAAQKAEPRVRAMIAGALEEAWK